MVIETINRALRMLLAFPSAHFRCDLSPALPRFRARAEITLGDRGGLHVGIRQAAARK
ncbi:hypothetical protein MPL3356_110384 [Mesorhizobium plurifarium]|uniref:Uncharacterized protein n=1 Tax=Mesorhizobium plurifarium TaxID=69974 RepID=A0A090DF96_MESPL|nr:hypothetical protein MPL3356_110384 [Mesorhizobium plurifarium]